MKWIVITVVLLLAACSSPREGFYVVPAERYPHQQKESQGFYYALPRNYVVMQVTVVREQQYPGPFQAYASKYLGLDNVIRENKTTWELADIEISTRYEPDPGQFYFVSLGEVPEKAASQIKAEFSETGLILNVNDDLEYNDHQQYAYQVDKDNGEPQRVFKHFPDYNLQEKVDTIIQQIHQDTITIERKILKRKLVEKSMEDRAKDAADFILKVKEEKMNLITGFQETPYSPETIKFMFDQLENIEKEYLKMFTGIRSRQQFTYQFVYMPKEDAPIAKKPMFRFSSQQGVVDLEKEEGQTVYLTLEKQPLPENVEEQIAKRLDTNIHQHGFYYRMPANAHIMVSMDEEPIAETKVLISQLGIINSLPVYYDKVRFYPSTGMIKSIEHARKEEDTE